MGFRYRHHTPRLIDEAASATAARENAATASGAVQVDSPKPEWSHPEVWSVGGSRMDRDGLDGSDGMDRDIEARIRQIPMWKGALAITPLKGGFSNQSWIVADDSGRHVVRFGVDYPFHHVFRDRELMVARAAHAAGFAPTVQYAAPGVMVSAFLEAQTFGPEEARANIARIATLIREFHQKMPRHVSGPGFYFSPFHIIRDYARLLGGMGDGMAAYLPRYLALADALEAVQVPLPIVFGHNDLLPANVLGRGGRLWLIDFEYAGFSTALFDLAGISSNSGFNNQETEALLNAYFGAPPDRALCRAMVAMQCVSLLREAMWGMVSEHHLAAQGTDFRAYATENLDKLDSALARYQSTYGAL